MPRAKTLAIGGGLRLPLEVVSACTTIVGQRGTGKTSTGVVMVEEAARAGAQYVVLDPTGAWWGLTSNAAGDGAGLDCVVMGGRHGDLPLDEHAGREVARLVADEGYSLVLDLDGLRSWAARQRFTADFCSELYERAHSQIYVVMDEAHRLAPQNRFDDNAHAARCLGAVSDLALLGRRRGVSTLLICQRPAKLNKDVLEASEVLIAHRVRGNNDRAQLRGWIEENDLDVRALLGEIASLGKGLAHVSAPTFDINGTYLVRPKATFDSSRSIGVREVQIQPKVRSEVNMDELRRRMAATIERAAADDPNALRKRIRELEREIAARPAEQVEVKVPFVPAELREHIEHHAGCLDVLGQQIKDQLEDRAVRFRDSLQLVESIAEQPMRTAGARTAPVRPAPTPSPTPSPAPRPPSPAGAPRVGAPRQRILDALSALEVIGVASASRTQVALFAKASPKSSGFEKNVSTLRTDGLIDYPAGGMLALTADGRAQANAPDSPATVEELHAYTRQLVGEAKWNLLGCIINQYPAGIDRSSLAELAGVSDRSSGFEKNISTLRSFGLIDYPEAGYVRAEPILFLEA